MFCSKVFDGFFGFCIGDALGVPVDFRSRQYLRENPVTEMIGYGTYNLPPGTWGDNSAVTFVTTAALTKGFSLEGIGENLVLWHDTGFWAANGEVVGAWNNPALSVKELKECMETHSGVNTGMPRVCNGALVRMLPLAYVIHGLPEKKRIKIVSDVTKITHHHPQSIAASVMYIELVNNLLSGASPQDAILGMQEVILRNFPHDKNLEAFKPLMNGKIVMLTEMEVSGASSAAESLKAAVWSLLQEDGFSATVLRAVNLGEDTDSAGALTGALAGIYYGYHNIPDKWIMQLAGKHDIQHLLTQYTRKLKAWENNRSRRKSPKKCREPLNE